MESIGDAWGFIGKTPITPSRGFSIETLIRVTLSWKMEYLDDCNTTIRHVARKVATMEGRLVCFGDDTTTGM